MTKKAPYTDHQILHMLAAASMWRSELREAARQHGHTVSEVTPMQTVIAWLSRDVAGR